MTSSPERTRPLKTSSGAPATVRSTMPITPKATPYRRGRVPVGHGYDSYDEDESPSGGRASSRHGRSPRSAHHSRSRQAYESRRSSRSSRSGSETETDEESETSVSTEEEKRERRRDRDRREKDRREKDRHEKPARHTVVERRRPADDKKPKRRLKIRKIVYMEEDDGSLEHTPRQSLDGRSSSRSRHRSRPSRPASVRYHSRQRSPSPARRPSHHRPSPKTYDISKPPSSSKRLAYEASPAWGDSDMVPSRHSRRHPPQIVHAETRPVRRSNTASGASHVTSRTHSTGSSHRHSSSFLGNLLTGSTLSYSSEKPVKQ